MSSKNSLPTEAMNRFFSIAKTDDKLTMASDDSIFSNFERIFITSASVDMATGR